MIPDAKLRELIALATKKPTIMQDWANKGHAEGQLAVRAVPLAEEVLALRAEVAGLKADLDTNIGLLRLALDREEGLRKELARIERGIVDFSKNPNAKHDGMLLLKPGATCLDSAELARLRARAALADEAAEIMQMAASIPPRDPVHHERVAALGNEIGFGALMSCATLAWRERLIERNPPAGGEFVSGPCRETVNEWLARYDAATKEKTDG